MMRVEKSRTTTCVAPYALRDCSASKTSLPDDRRCSICRRTRRLLAPRRALLAHRHQRAHAAFVARAPRLDALPQPGFLLRQPLVELLLRSASLASHSSFLRRKVA